jgi:hypothetical protein
MSSAPRSESAPALADRVGSSRPTRFRAWPLWGALAGVAGFVGTVVTDLRPDAELEAVAQNSFYAVTPADMTDLDPTLARYGYIAGVVAIIALLVFQAAWRRHVETAFTRSTAARLASGGMIATAGAAMLGYGWRGGLATYLGPEGFNYDETGKFVYYMLTDFGAYLPWFGIIAVAGAIGWMAWVERSVSRVLGTFSALVAVGLVGAVIVSGVPGLPGGVMPLWLAVAGVWLAIGRSRITQSSDT